MGARGKREAQAKAREFMSTINRADYVFTSQINVGRFLNEYSTMHVDRLAASTRGNYKSHLKNHIRPAFADAPWSPNGVQIRQKDSDPRFVRGLRMLPIYPRASIEMGGWRLWRDGKDQTPPWLVMGSRHRRVARGDPRLQRLRASALEGHRAGGKRSIGMGEVPREKLVWADTSGAIL